MYREKDKEMNIDIAPFLKQALLKNVSYNLLPIWSVHFKSSGSQSGLRTTDYDWELLTVVTALPCMPCF